MRRRCPAWTATRASSSRDLLGPRASSAPPYSRPATTWPRAASRTVPARSIVPARRSATRATSCSPPRASSLPCCGSRSATRPRPKRANSPARFGLPVADKHDSQDICFVPTGRYTEVIERLMPGAADPGDIVDQRRPRARPPRRHHSLHRRPASRAWRRGRRATVCGRSRRLQSPRRCRPARGAAHDAHAAARRELARRSSGDAAGGPARRVRQGALDAAAAAGLAHPHGRQYDVEFVDGEEGVAPGQACVFYDAPTGQAHVLGGGFIKSATAHAGLAERSHHADARAAVRG